MATSELEAGHEITLASLPIRDDPFIRSLLGKLPEQISMTFTDGQLVALKAALGGRSWGVHAIDLRWTIGFWRWHYYLVLLAGRNYRALTRREQEMRRLALAAMLVVFGAVSTLFGILVLYFLTSALSIDQIPGFSFDIWDWFKQKLL